MDDFLTYFLAGMLGEELLRKIATRPFGFWVLWAIGFTLIILFFTLLISVVVIAGIFTDPAAEESVLRYVLDCFALVVREFKLWPVLAALGGGILLAISYRSHYLDKHSDTQK